MSTARDAMISELKRVVVPVLRHMRFRGSFPHFRRTESGRVDLLTFQFSMAGGQFVVEIGYFPAAGYKPLSGALIPASEVRMRHLRRRLRLGATSEKTDHWFVFESGNYTKAAEAVLPYLRDQAESWWQQDGRNALRKPDDNG